MELSSVILDCERMKYEDTGIYYYCLNLATHIRERMDPTSEKLTCYVPANAQGLFKGPVLHHNWYHKILLPPLFNCNIWHATYQQSAYVPSLNRNIKVVLTIHDLNFMYDEQVPELKKKKYLINLQQRIDRADVIVCVSEYSKKDVFAFCKTSGKVVVVIHNGTNTLQKPLLNNISYKPQRPFLFALGTINRKKNFHVLLSLIKQNPQFDLIIGGKAEDKDYLNEIKALAKKEAVQDNLHIVGRISETEKAWYYHNCKAFLLPSVAEGFGLPLVEAMSVGKPVFLSNRTALPEIGSDAAFYFKDFSREGMHESFMKGMLQFESSDMTAFIKKRAETFSWNKAAGSYIRLYQSLYRN